MFSQPAAAQPSQVASASSVQQAPVHSSPASVTANVTPNRQPDMATDGKACIAFCYEYDFIRSFAGRRNSFGCQRGTKGSGDEDVQPGRICQESERDQAAQNATVAHVPRVQQPEQDSNFNERDLNYYWQEYAGQLPKEQVAIAKRMQVLRPVLLNNSTTFEIVVDNEIAAKDFTALIPELQDYLRVRLKNSKVVMTVRVSAPTETVRAVGRVEKFQMMSQKNQALMQLKEEFGLELY